MPKKQSKPRRSKRGASSPEPNLPGDREVDQGSPERGADPDQREAAAADAAAAADGIVEVLAALEILGDRLTAVEARAAESPSRPHRRPPPARRVGSGDGSTTRSRTSLTRSRVADHVAELCDIGISYDPPTAYAGHELDRVFRIAALVGVDDGTLPFRLALDAALDPGRYHIEDPIVATFRLRAEGQQSGAGNWKRDLRQYEFLLASSARLAVCLSFALYSAIAAEYTLRDAERDIGFFETQAEGAVTSAWFVAVQYIETASELDILKLKVRWRPRRHPRHLLHGHRCPNSGGGGGALEGRHAQSGQPFATASDCRGS